MTQQEPVEVPAAAARFETVDLLRGLSILAVVLLHSWLRFFLNGVQVGTGLPKWLSHLLLRNGGNGFCDILRNLRFSHHVHQHAAVRQTWRYAAGTVVLNPFCADRTLAAPDSRS
jgi:hypothetical protein